MLFVNLGVICAESIPLWPRLALAQALLSQASLPPLRHAEAHSLAHVVQGGNGLLVGCVCALQTQGGKDGRSTCEPALGATRCCLPGRCVPLSCVGPSSPHAPCQLIHHLTFARIASSSPRSSMTSAYRAWMGSRCATCNRAGVGVSGAGMQPAIAAGQALHLPVPLNQAMLAPMDEENNRWPQGLAQ